MSVLQRDAEIALQNLADPREILDRDGVVEAILLAQECQNLRIPLLARHRQHGVARQELLQGEHQHRHDDDRRDRDQDTSGDEAKHELRRPDIREEVRARRRAGHACSRLSGREFDALETDHAVRDRA